MAKMLPNTKQEQDAAFDPEHVRAINAARAAEQAGQDQRDAFNAEFENPERLAQDGVSGDLSGSAREREENPTFRNRVNSKYGGYKRQPGTQLTTANMSAVLKKRGPLGLLITIVTGGGIAGFMGLNALMPIHIVENFMARNDTQNTSFTHRTNKLLNRKLNDDLTAGDCTFTRIACRFQRPSSKLLKNLEKQGVRAYTKDGDLINPKTFVPNKRPGKYVFTNKAGKSVEVFAENFAKTLVSNPEFRAAFHNAYKPRFVSYADAIFKVIKDRFGFRSNNSLGSADSTEEVNDTLNDISAGDDTGAADALAESASDELSDEAAEGLEEVVEEQLTKTGNDQGKKLAKSGKGNAFGLIAGGVCLLSDVPGLVITTVRAYQMIQLVKYAATITTTIYAMKAGDATPEEVSAIGDLLTSTVDGKSALDSFGMMYGLFGDTRSNNNNHKKFSPGASVIGVLGGVNQITGSRAKIEACNVATNPATGLAVDAALAGGTLGIGTVINVVGGFAISAAMTKLVPELMPAAISFISPILKPLASFFLGDLTKNLLGESAGNAFSSGLLNMMGQTANARGNAALKVNEAVEYAKLTNEINIAYAEEDRATHSPFDASNPNTALGSIVSSLIPYYSKMSSVSGIISTIGSVVSSSIGSILKPTSVSAVSEDPAQYQLCEDPAISENNIAAGPFCNIVYGIPVQYIDKDPIDILKELQDSGDIDEYTGEPIDKGKDVLTTIGLTPDESGYNPGGLKEWLDLCTDGSALNANNCRITDETTANYALYSIDHSIQKTMDGEDEVLDTPSNDEASSAFNGIQNEISSSKAEVNKISSQNFLSNLSNIFHKFSMLFDTGRDRSFDTSALYAKPYTLPPRKLEGIII